MAAWVTGNVRMLALNAIKFKVHHLVQGESLGCSPGCDSRERQLGGYVLLKFSNMLE